VEKLGPLLTWLRSFWSRLLRGELSVTIETRAARVFTLLLLLLSAAGFAHATAVVLMRAWFEAQGLYNVDTTLYWTIGRGITQGYMPYRDLFETKPPGVFVLSALSFALTGDYGLTHAAQVLAILFVAFAPCFVLVRLLKPQVFVERAALCLALGSVWMTLVGFSAVHAGEVQTEMLGLAPAIGYALLVGKPGWLPFVARALAVGVSIGMKEPFALVLPAAYLAMDPVARRPVADLFGPLALAATAGVFLLAVLGWLPSYLHLYLATMFGGHTQVAGAPVERMLNYPLTIATLAEYSYALPTALSLCALAYIFADGAGTTARRVQIVLLGAVVSGLAVGLGATFYVHHHVLIMPLAMAIVLTLLRSATLPATGRSWWTSGFVLFSLALPRWESTEKLEEHLVKVQRADASARDAARIIDRIADRLRIERWQWLGPGAYAPYPFTRHLPQGPLFFQQVVFFEGKYPPWFAEQLRAQIRQSSLLVVHNPMFVGRMLPQVRGLINAHFESLPDDFLLPGERMPYGLFVRKGLLPRR